MKFKKYEGLGNDFIILNEDVTKEQIVKLCDRHFGIGADGLIVETYKDGKPFMTFYNADASVASMCGNGIRCYAAYLEHKGVDFSSILTLAGEKKITKENGQYRVFMGKAKIDFLDKEYKDVKLNSIYTGTEHCVIVDETKKLEFLEKEGYKLAHNDEIFPIGTNVNLVKVIDNDNIEMLTYERGVGITLACGTGACASAYLTNLMDLTSNDVNVKLLGGTLKISLKEEGIYMTGPAKKVFEGEIEI